MILIVHLIWSQRECAHSLKANFGIGVQGYWIPGSEPDGGQPFEEKDLAMRPGAHIAYPASSR